MIVLTCVALIIMGWLLSWRLVGWAAAPESDTLAVIRLVAILGIGVGASIIAVVIADAAS